MGRFFGEHMRRTVLIVLVAIIAFAAIGAFSFLKTVYLPRRAAEFLDRHLAGAPVPVSYEIESIGLIPPSLSFETVVIGVPDRFRPTVFSSCTVRNIVGYLRNGTGPLRIVCERLTVPVEMPSPEIIALFTEQRTGEKGTEGSSARRLPDIDFTVETAVLSFGKETLSFTASGHLSATELSLTVTPPRGSTADTFLQLTAERETHRVTLTAHQFPLEPYTAPWLPEPGTYARGLLSGSVELVGTPSDAQVFLDLSVEEIALAHPFLDTEPFHLPFLRISGNAGADLRRRYLFTNEISFSIGGIEVTLHGSFERSHFDTTLSLSETPLNRLATVVRGRLFDGFLMDGSLAATITAAGIVRPGDISFESVGITGEIKEPKQLTDRMERYKAGFDFFFTDDDGTAFRVAVKNQGVSYAPLALLPEYVWRAVVLSEDAGFFLHPGIDFAEMDAAFKDNLVRRTLRGGSTITQQVIKNLFLTRDKTILRKFREMLLAIELDASLPKERILEIYLNLIEWGPGIFGIGNAARYYFGKLPEELLPHEAAWLASIIPNPKRFQHEYITGTISEARTARLQHLLDLLFQNGWISGDLYLFSYTAPFLFRHDDAGEAP